MPDVAVTVIGGGVVGLAVAAELSRSFSPLYLLERNPRYGQETSSRNSEVIHAGIYYITGSLKARLCVEGNRLLYEICREHDIPHRRITKIITATKTDELPELERIFQLGSANGAELRMITADDVHRMEPGITSVGGLYSPSTGIISAHGLMDFFAHVTRENGAVIQSQCEVVGIERRSADFALTVRENDQLSTFSTERVVNAAGLESDTIAALAGIDIDSAGYRLHWCKGSYFALPSALSRVVSRLVYPVPLKDSLGVHAVLDLGGRLKFGPDVEYLSHRRPEYAVDQAKRHEFAESVRRILPNVNDDDLTADMSGIRPKLQVKGASPRDFVIADESARGLEGFINLIGIESPGLTASPAIARYVHSLMTE
jgi:L-2-hydroxyglutarate oxidase LhgO